MPTYQMQAPDGKTYQIPGPDGASDDQVRAEIIKQHPHLGAPAAPPPTEKPPLHTPMTDMIPDPLAVAGNALHALRIPLKAAFDLAGKADVASGIKTPEQAASRANTYANIPIPMLMAALTGGGSLPAQALLQGGTTAAMQAGGLEEKSPASIVASGALPFVGPTIARLARAIPRSLTRMIPSRFAKAQASAQEAGESVAKGFEPSTPEATGELWKAARAAGTEPVPAANLAQMLSSLDESIPKNPVDPGLQATRALMKSAGEVLKSNQTIDLGDLMRLRVDAGASMRRSPQVAALYKGIMGDLDAAAATGPGAKLAMDALDMSRKAHGAEIFRDLIERSSRQTALSGDAKLLDMAKLRKLLGQNKDELLKRVGPEGLSQIEHFVTRFYGLPPAQAYTWANKLAGSTAGLMGLGVAGPGLAPAIGGALGYELLNNALAVGKNPAELNRFLIMLGAGAKTLGTGGMAQQAVESRK